MLLNTVNVIRTLAFRNAKRQGRNAKVEFEMPNAKVETPRLSSKRQGWVRNAKADMEEQYLKGA